MIKAYLKPILLIFIGTAIYAFGLVHFNMQNNLAEGGFTGITLLLYFLFSIKPSISTIFLNIPIFILGYFILGKRTFILTIIGTLSLSFFLEIFETFQLTIFLKDDMFLATLLAGIFSGVGLGIVFRVGGTTGGVDILARLALKFKKIPIGKTIFLFDFIIITLSWIFYLDYKEALYTLVALFLSSLIIDRFQEGFTPMYAITIRSKKSVDLASALKQIVDHEIICLSGYSVNKEEDSSIIYFLVEKKQLEPTKKFIFTLDSNAVLTILTIHETVKEDFI